VLQFELPWLWLLLPLPLLIRLFAPAYKQVRPALRLPMFGRLVEGLNQEASSGATVAHPHRLQRLLRVLLWGLLVAAVARPVWLEPPVFRERALRDLLLAVDVSLSMETADFVGAGGNQVRRLDAVREVVDGFIEHRPKDRIGLVLFGGQAFPQAPFTRDHIALRQLLAEADAGLAGSGTAVGDAIGQAVKLFADSSAEEKLVVLLTDGNDTGSSIPPLAAAGVAAEQGITVHTIGVGDPEAVAEARFDIELLEDIAQRTGGQFFRAEDREQLTAAYVALDRIAPARVHVLEHRPRRPLFHWPLQAALLLLALAVLWRIGRDGRLWRRAS
jgi:Ca-activated chloride channel family protein